MTATRTPAGTPAGPPDPPAAAQRRRGVALEQAILAAAYAELTDVGYTALTVEGVAARARTGKASIYRRWPTKAALVLDAMEATMPRPVDCGLEPVFDDDVTTVDALRLVARNVARMMRSPAGEAMRAIKFEATNDPELARLVDERFQAPRRAAMLSLFERGVARGEVRPGAATQLVADLLPAVFMHRMIMLGETLTEESVNEIIDQVLMPLVACE